MQFLLLKDLLIYKYSEKRGKTSILNCFFYLERWMAETREHNHGGTGWGGQSVSQTLGEEHPAGRHTGSSVSQWGAAVRAERRLQTYAVMEMLAADIGLTSLTSRAFCRASFLLAASSCSSSSFAGQRGVIVNCGMLVQTQRFWFLCVSPSRRNKVHLYRRGVNEAFRRPGRPTFVSSCALARLSTAMARNTFRRVSEWQQGSGQHPHVVQWAAILPLSSTARNHNVADLLCVPHSGNQSTGNVSFSGLLVDFRFTVSH